MAIRRSSIIKAASLTAVAAVIATVAIVADGFDVAQTPVNDSAVWALQAGDGDRYARINTELHEIDTVKEAQNPSGLLQTATTALLLMERNGRIADVDPARPQDFTAETAELSETPQGTEHVISSGPFVGYLTDSGDVYAARIDDGAEATTQGIDPYAAANAQPDATPRAYAADSIAISTSGVLYSYSIDEGAVLSYDLTTGDELGFQDVPNAPEDEGTQLSVVGSTWVLLSADGASLWVAGSEPVDTDLADDAVLQHPSSNRSAVYVASRSGLISVDLSDRSLSSEVERAGAIGIPAAPAEHDGDIYAAWLPENGDSGLLWSSAEGESDLDYGTQELGTEPEPVLRSNDSNMILNDIQSGWVWTIPDGALVPSSQDWAIAAAADDDTTDEEEQASVVTERKPPVAEDDQFGVRAGQLVSLPVLLNDHDPNEDILTIDPASISGLDASFGTVTVTNNSQDLAIQVAPGAAGVASFTYLVTDGTQSDGLMSIKSATVTLTVFGDGVNNAPVWCGVSECVREWPVLQVQPGRSASAEVLRGWVDPEGDPIYLASAINLGTIGSVATTPDGTVLFQHPDAALSAGSTELTVRIADIRGKVAEKALTVEVTATPSMTVEPFAVTGTAGEALTINPGKHISSVAGSYVIVTAKTEQEDGSVTTVDNGGTSFSFSAPTAGNYFISYTVQDDLTEVIGTVRVQVLAPGSQQLTASPITVFVRPKADATVDVFPSVNNPSNTVLLLTEALPSPFNGAGLEVAVVNQQLLRVKGTTADGQAGVLGTVRYTVSDGTGNALQTAQGQATVILLPLADAQPPIAVADALTVRAGSQIDIPVLDNDLAPDGNSLVLNPDGLIYDAKEGLAFVSGSQVRLLAPTTPGDYQAMYTVYSAGSPGTSAQATIRITVIPEGENRAPEPHTLVGRVLAGSTVSIPFDSFGIDPDGDAVWLDRIISQPESGSATIAANGAAIVYTSVSGFVGPVEFEYQVADQFGDTGTAFVRVGVIDQDSDPSPVTYSDYVEVQVGAENRVLVQPAANDIDPAGRTLEITNVVPDAPLGTAEYADLLALIGPITDGVVTINAGEVLGPHSFFYTVTNSTGDTGIGLIVMKVVRETVPDHPRVADTYLTIEDRSAFSSGIDVVSGKVTWNSGNISDLTLSLWDQDQGFAADGWKISGTLPEESVVVPFQLTGKNILGVEVSTFGFLRIPGKNQVILALKSGTPPVEVDESKSRTFDLADLVTLPSGESLQLEADSVTTAGKRADATCEVSSGTSLNYSAGAGDPWVDYCAVPARLAGQDHYTVLIVPIVVVPEIPLPIMRSAAITQSPAAPDVTYDLLNMVDWAGKADDDSLEFDYDYTGDQFLVQQVGTVLTIHAIDTAIPGREDTVRVFLTSHPDVESAGLSLKVGPLPAELPKGGTIGYTCKQTQASCVIKVIGIPGEVNVYRDTPLTLSSVSVPDSCTGISMDVVDGHSIRISYTEDAPGAKCTASFVVKDPSGRPSPEDRNGSLLLDFQGLPKAPSSLSQVAYGDGTIELAINPGQAVAAYPPLTGFTVYNGTSVATHCTPQGVCDPITGLTNGDKRSYSAFADNDIGDSTTSADLPEAWAYRPPTTPTLALAAVYPPVATDDEGGVTLTITDTDSSITRFEVSATGYSDVVTRDSSGVTETTFSLGVGDRTVTVTPISVVDVPPGVGLTPSSTSDTVTVIGRPSITDVGVLAAVDENSLSVTGATFDDRFAGSGALDVQYIAYLATGSAPSCSVDSGGSLTVSGGSGSTNAANISVSTPNKVYNVKICISNGFGIDEESVGSVRPFRAPVTPAGWRYTIAPQPDGSFLVGAVTGPAEASGDFTSTTAASGYGAGTLVTVTFCLIEDPSLCGTPSPVSPLVATEVYQYQVTSKTPAACVWAATPSPTVAGNFAAPSASPTVVVTEFRAFSSALDASGTVVPGPNPLIPADTYSITNVKYTIAFDAGGGGTYTYSGTFAGPYSCPQYVPPTTP